MKTLRMLLVFAGALAMIIPAALADLVYESDMVTSGSPMGGGPENSKMKTYTTGENMRVEKAKSVTIIKLGEGKSYDLDTVKKTYTVIDLNKMMEGNAQMAAAMKQMMENMMKDMKVEKTAEAKDISGYKCTKYLVTMMGTQSEYWMSSDVKGYKELREKMMKLAEKYKDNQMIQSTVGIGGAMEKMDGFPIMTHMKMGTIENKTTVTKIEETKIDPKLFEIPADYAKIEGPMEEMMKQPKGDEE